MSFRLRGNLACNECFTQRTHHVSLSLLLDMLWKCKPDTENEKLHDSKIGFGYYPQKIFCAHLVLNLLSCNLKCTISFEHLPVIKCFSAQCFMSLKLSFSSLIIWYHLMAAALGRNIFVNIKEFYMHNLSQCLKLCVDKACSKANWSFYVLFCCLMF
jgi:hypothetical protein